jgi:hypothetical protein
MDTVTIYRIERGDQGVFGRLFYKQFKCFTGELPDRDNQSNISCIPDGLFKVVWDYSVHLKKYTYHVIGIPKREGVRIHSANLMGDTTKGWKAQLLGCIALGEKIGYINKQRAILVSQPAVRIFNEMLAKQTFMLEIKCLKSSEQSLAQSSLEVPQASLALWPNALQTTRTNS